MLSKYYIYTLLAYAIPIIGYVYNPGSVGAFSIIQAVLLFILYTSLRKKGIIAPPKYDKRIKWFGFVILFGIIHFFSKGNYDWTSMSLLISSLIGYLSIFYFIMVQDIRCVKYYLKAFVMVLIPTAFISYLNWNGFLGFDIPHIIAPFALFFLLTPFFTNKLIKYSVIVIYLAAVISDVSVRSCLLTGVICSCVLILYKFTSASLFSKIANSLRYFFLITPLFLLALALFADFNVFAEMESTDVSSFETGSGRKSDSRSLNTDSRTGVYLDVLYSLENVRDVVFGKGEVINLETTWIDVRHSVEAGILNIFLKYGLVGCIVFFLIFWHSTKQGVYNTNNTLTQLVAIYLSYKFFYMFIEDANINISTLIAYGICMNSRIRNLTDSEIKIILSNEN